MGRAQGQKNIKSECLNILWVRMDHLVMFVHPNEEVVPLANTTINNMLPTNHQPHITHKTPLSMSDDNGDWTERTQNRPK
jgi:hypothetical protein